MTQGEVCEGPNAVFRGVPDDKGVTVSVSTPANDIEGRDSRAHIDPMVAVEKKFGIGCTMREVNGMQNVGETDDFQVLCEREHKLPYGLINTRVGKGHFNADGHRVIAEKLKETMAQLMC